MRLPGFRPRLPGRTIKRKRQLRASQVPQSLVSRSPSLPEWPSGDAPWTSIFLAARCRDGVWFEGSREKRMSWRELRCCPEFP